MATLTQILDNTNGIFFPKKKKIEKIAKAKTEPKIKNLLKYMNNIVKQSSDFPKYDYMVKAVTNKFDSIQGLTKEEYKQKVDYFSKGIEKILNSGIDKRYSNIGELKNSIKQDYTLSLRDKKNAIDSLRTIELYQNGIDLYRLHAPQELEGFANHFSYIYCILVSN